MTIEYVKKICKFDEWPTVCKEIGPIVLYRGGLTDNKLIRRLSIVTEYEFFKFKQLIKHNPELQHLVIKVEKRNER